MARVTSDSLSQLIKPAIAFLAPVALALAFPKTNWWLLSFVSLAPLFWLWSNASWKSAFWWGWLSGTVYFGLMLNWVPNSLGDFIGAWTILALALLAAWQGLAFAAAAVLISLIRRPGFGGVAVYAAPAAWFICEFVRTRGELGVPFASLGLVAAHIAWLLPMAAYAGVFGIGAIVALINGAVAGLVWGTPRGRATACAILGALAVLVIAGDVARAHVVQPAPRWKVAIAQGNISQRVKWSPEIFTHTIQVYSDLTRQASKRGARVVVWPETVVTAYPLQEPWLLHDLEAIASSAHVWLIAGTVDKLTPRGYHNAVIDLTPKGKLDGVYDKHLLVPFAEFLPFDRVLRRLPLMNQASDFFPGTGPRLLSGDGVPFGILVCYESGFSSYARQTANAGAQALIVVTDDAWWGDTSGPYQHLDMAVLDAVETGRWVVRGAATGVSAVVDPHGSIVGSQPLDQLGLLVANIGRPIDTPYLHFGALWLVLLALIGVAIGLVKGRARAVGWRSARGPA
ncbi:MAG TPA: apolipoprotein N-acyltransferase [Candidatus Eremiobacteraceae bacterium]